MKRKAATRTGSCSGCPELKAHTAAEQAGEYMQEACRSSTSCH